MMGFRGLEFTSRTGAKFRWTPTALASIAVMRPYSRANRSSPMAPKAMVGGKEVPPPWGKKGGEGIAVVDPHPRATVLEVRRHQKGNPGPGLEGIQLGAVGVGQADGDDDPADPRLLHIPGIFLEFGAGGGRVGPGHPGERPAGRWLL